MSYEQAVKHLMRFFIELPPAELLNFSILERNDDCIVFECSIKEKGKTKQREVYVDADGEVMIAPT